MFGALAVAGGTALSGIMRGNAAAKAAKAAKQDRRMAVQLSEDDYRNNMAQREADQNEANALRDRDQANANALRDRDQMAMDQYRDRDQAVSDQITAADQARAIEYARSDEARSVAAHREAVGYDLGRLVSDAQASGLNPLTVLAATGAANYARTAAPVISTPFIGRQMVGSEVARSSAVGSQLVGRPMIDRAGIYTGASGVVQAARSDKMASAGYIGDVIAGAGEAYIGYSQEQARLAADRDLAEAIRTGGSKGTQVGKTAKSGGFQVARQVDSRPVGNVPPTGYIGRVLPSENPTAAGPNDLMFGGVKWRHAPDTSTMNDIENVYGDSELVSTLGAIGLGARDAQYNWGSQVYDWLDGRAKRAASWLPPARSAADMLAVGP